MSALKAVPSLHTLCLPQNRLGETRLLAAATLGSVGRKSPLGLPHHSDDVRVPSNPCSYEHVDDHEPPAGPGTWTHLLSGVLMVKSAF